MKRGVPDPPSKERRASCVFEILPIEKGFAMRYGKSTTDAGRDEGVVARGAVFRGETRDEAETGRYEVRPSVTEEPPAWEVDPFYFG